MPAAIIRCSLAAHTRNGRSIACDAASGAAATDVLGNIYCVHSATSLPECLASLGAMARLSGRARPCKHEV